MSGNVRERESAVERRGRRHNASRTGLTALTGLGFAIDWIEQCLAHEDGPLSRGVNWREKFAAQRRHMLQEAAALIDA